MNNKYNPKNTINSLKEKCSENEPDISNICNVFSIYYVFLSMIYTIDKYSNPKVFLIFDRDDISKYFEYALNMYPILSDYLLKNVNINKSKININLQDTLNYSLQKKNNINIDIDIDYSQENIEYIISHLIAADGNSNLAIIANYDGVNFSTVFSEYIKSRIDKFLDLSNDETLIIPILINVKEDNLKYYHIAYFLIYKKLIYYYDPYIVCLNNTLKIIYNELINIMIKFIDQKAFFIDLAGFCNKNTMEEVSRIKDLECREDLLPNSFGFCSMWNRYVIHQIISLASSNIDYPTVLENIEKNVIKELYQTNQQYKDYLLGYSEDLFDKIRTIDYDFRFFTKSIDLYIQKMSS